jgi:hypothetical protein
MTRADWLHLAAPTAGSLLAFYLTTKVAAWRLRKL